LLFAPISSSQSVSHSRLCQLQHIRAFPTRRSSDLAGRRVVAEGITAQRLVVDLGVLRNQLRAARKVIGVADGEHACTRNRPDSLDRKSTRLNSSHVKISYAVFCMTKKLQLKNKSDS